MIKFSLILSPSPNLCLTISFPPHSSQKHKHSRAWLCRCIRETDGNNVDFHTVDWFKGCHYNQHLISLTPCITTVRHKRNQAWAKAIIVPENTSKATNRKQWKGKYYVDLVESTVGGIWSHMTCFHTMAAAWFWPTLKKISFFSSLFHTKHMPCCKKTTTKHCEIL